MIIIIININDINNNSFVCDLNIASAKQKVDST